MGCVNSLLVLLLVLAALVQNLVDCLLQKDLQLSLLLHVLVKLRAGLFKEFALVFHLFTEGLDHTLIAKNFVFFCLLLAGWLEEERTFLLRLGQEGLY